MAAGRWFDRERGDRPAVGDVGGARAARRAASASGWSARSAAGRQTHDARFLRLGVIEGSPAIAFYERLGFVVTGETQAAGPRPGRHGRLHGPPGLIEQQRPSRWARSAASRSPSPAATIEPFIRMCHWRANGSGSAIPASRRQLGRRTPGCAPGTRPPRGAADGRSSGCSSITLMNEQPSKPGLRNHSSNTSKIASSRSRGIAGPPADLGGQPAVGPQLLAPGQEREHQVLLGAEVAVHRLARHAGALDDRVDADGLHALAREQLVGRGQQPLASVAGVRRGHTHAANLPVRVPGIGRPSAPFALRSPFKACAPRASTEERRGRDASAGLAAGRW